MDPRFWRTRSDGHRHAPQPSDSRRTSVSSSRTLASSQAKPWFAYRPFGLRVGGGRARWALLSGPHPAGLPSAPSPSTLARPADRQRRCARSGSRRCARRAACASPSAPEPERRARPPQPCGRLSCTFAGHPSSSQPVGRPEALRRRPKPCEGVRRADGRPNAGRGRSGTARGHADKVRAQRLASPVGPTQPRGRHAPHRPRPTTPRAKPWSPTLKDQPEKGVESTDRLRRPFVHRRSSLAAQAQGPSRRRCPSSPRRGPARCRRGPRRRRTSSSRRSRSWA